MLKPQHFLVLNLSLLTGLIQTPAIATSAEQSLVIKAKQPLLLAQNQAKRRIAVLDFDFSNVSSPSVLSAFPNVSKGVSDILVNRLVKDGTYTLIERSRIDAVLNEQNLGDSGRIDPSTAAQIGKILGVDAVIIGSVTRLDLQTRQSGGSFLFGIGGNSTDVDAYAQINIRMVSTSTAEILAVAEGTGNISQSDSRVTVLGIGGGSQTFNPEKLVFIATEQAIDQVAKEVINASEKLQAIAPVSPSINAVVAAVVGRQVILNKGTSAGIRVGSRIVIERVTQVIKDPTTGQVIRRLSQPIGQIRITEVDSTSSVGEIVSGSQFKVGDIAKFAN